MRTGPLRTALYVPGSHPDRFDKALGSGADAIVVDLEDAVAADQKSAARANLLAWLDKRTPIAESTGVWVRVNNTDLLEADVAAAVRPGVTGVFLPKCESRSELDALSDMLAIHEENRRMQPLAVSPLIESAVGLLASAAIASGPRVSFLQLGEVDLAADLGLEPGDDGREMAWPRAMVVIASAAAGVAAPLGAVSVETRDMAAFAAETAALRRHGFWGRACIHPAQLPSADTVFTTTAEEVTRARAMLDLLCREGGAAVLDESGRLVDGAVVRQACSLVRRSEGVVPLGDDATG